jgi:hypothetical protein
MNPELIKKFRQDLKKYNLKIDPDVINYAKHLGIRTTRARVGADSTPSAAAPAGVSNTSKPAAPQPTSTPQQLITFQQSMINYIRKKLGSNDKLDALMQLLIDKVKNTRDLQQLEEINTKLQQIVNEIEKSPK